MSCGINSSLFVPKQNIKDGIKPVSMVVNYFFFLKIKLIDLVSSLFLLLFLIKHYFLFALLHKFILTQKIFNEYVTLNG